jgi:hypothetical protein
MQVRISSLRFPSALILLLFALAAATVLGGVLGYALKPSVVTPIAVTHSTEQTGAQYDSPCVWTGKEKAC